MVIPLLWHAMFFYNTHPRCSWWAPPWYQKSHMKTKGLICIRETYARNQICLQFLCKTSSFTPARSRGLLPSVFSSSSLWRWGDNDLGLWWLMKLTLTSHQNDKGSPWWRCQLCFFCPFYAFIVQKSEREPGRLFKFAWGQVITHTPRWRVHAMGGGYGFWEVNLKSGFGGGSNLVIACMYVWVTRGMGYIWGVQL